MSELVLALFPGLGLLDRSFVDAGYTVVRGPDPLWCGDIRDFHPPPGIWGGCIGGPPCQPFSRLVHMVRANGYEPRHENLIPEFERCVLEAQPDWFLMEEVVAAPLPVVDGYVVWSRVLNNRWFGESIASVGAEQERVRRISFGTRDGRPLALDVAAFQSPVWEPAVTGHGQATPVKLSQDGKGGHVVKSTAKKGVRSLAAMCVLQGLPPGFLNASPFTESAKRQLIGNGVPIPLGRAIARAVRRAMDAPGCVAPYQEAAG